MKWATGGAMTEQDFDNYLKDRYKNQIAWYDQKSLANQRKYRIFQWSVIILSAATPILAVLQNQYADHAWLQWLLLVVSFTVAVVTTSLKTFKYEENWIQYRTTCETLKKELHYYRAGLDQYGLVDDKEAAFVERVENLISRENSLWTTTHTRKESDDGPSVK